MLLGTGVDVVEIARIEDSLRRFGDRFLRRVFTDREVEYCLRKQKNMAESLAARFAAKEAGAKALGTGISRGVGWKEIEVARAPGDPPRLLLHGAAQGRAARMGVRRSQLAITHGGGLAIATVHLED